MDKRTAALLCYLLGWVTGLIFLFGGRSILGRDDPDVKYHAAQSIVVFGALSVVSFLLSFIANALIDSGLYRLFTSLNSLVGLVILVAWIVCLVLAWTRNGERFQVPLIGATVTPYAERIAGNA